MVYTASTIIEQQTSVIDADFFVWFYSSETMTEMIKIQAAMRSCWGLEHIWCGAARAYRDIIYKDQIQNWEHDQMFRPPCAIIMTPINHVNTMSIAKGEAFRAKGYYLNALAFNYTYNKPGGLNDKSIGDVKWALDNGIKYMEESEKNVYQMSKDSSEELGIWALHQILLCKTTVKNNGIVKNNPWVHPLTRGWVFGMQ